MHRVEQSQNEKKGEAGEEADGREKERQGGVLLAVEIKAEGLGEEEIAHDGSREDEEAEDRYWYEERAARRGERGHGIHDKDDDDYI